MSEKMGLFFRKGEDGSTSKSLMPLADIAAVIVSSGGKILTVFNERWGAFTIPMTKVRAWKDPVEKEAPERQEEWMDAAMRAAAEVLGRTVEGNEFEFLMDVSEFQQSDRDSRWKRYRMKAYGISPTGRVGVPSNAVTQWLTPEEIMDENRGPISPTARHAIAELQLQGRI